MERKNTAAETREQYPMNEQKNIQRNNQFKPFPIWWENFTYLRSLTFPKVKPQRPTTVSARKANAENPAKDMYLGTQEHLDWKDGA